MTGLVVRAKGCDPLLIDTCGGFELARQLAQAGLTFSEVRNVVATHRHMDHIGGFGALTLARQPLDIYAIDDAHEGIRGMLAATFPEWEHNPETRHITVEPGERREIGGFAVAFFAVEHRVPTVAVRVEHGGRTLAFSADCVPCDGVAACARDADLFLCDVYVAASAGDGAAERAHRLGHPTARDAGEIATAAGAKALILLHLSRLVVLDDVLAEARAYFAGPVYLAKDGSTYTV
jgi:ribonuclease BN (tRNA processing enzyme)